MMFVSRGIIKLKYRLGHGTPVHTLYAAVVRVHEAGISGYATDEHIMGE